MFSSAIKSINGASSFNDMSSGGTSLNKVLSSKTTVNTSKPKTYMGDHYVNGIFCPAGMY